MPSWKLRRQTKRLAGAIKLVGRAPSATEQARKIMQLLINSGTLVRVGDLFFHREALDNLMNRLREHAEQPNSDRTIDVASFKALSGVSRKYAIPLLEYLDRARITRQEGDRRLIVI
ncbi:MAG: SelB C-terminal domain-containing protein [Pyrinomonadaceae bacterium]